MRHLTYTRADDQVASEGFDSSEKGFRVGSQIPMQDLVALAVEDTDVDRPGMQIDATVMLVLSGEESHNNLPPGLYGNRTHPAYPIVGVGPRGP